MFGDHTPSNIVWWPNMLMLKWVAKRFKHVWSKQNKQLIQAAEQAWYACPHRTCLICGCPNEQNFAHQTREQKKCFTFMIECSMAFNFYQTRPNTIKHDQTRSNSTKQDVETVKCLVKANQCLMVFGRQTFSVCPGPNINFWKEKAFI